MVSYKFLVMPVLLLSLLVLVHLTESSKANRSGAKKLPKKLARLLALTKPGSNSTSRSRSKSRDGESGNSETEEKDPRSALTLALCDETPTLEHIIMIEVIGDKDEDGRGATVAVGLREHGSQSPYKVRIGDIYPQKTIRKIKMSGRDDQVVCVKSLVVDVTIMIDQPTEFKKTCPEEPDVDDLPCRQFDDAVMTPFVCPAKLTNVLETKSQLKSVPDEMPTDYTPPVYDITNDMMQASAAIVEGVAEGLENVVKGRMKQYKTALKSRPMGNIASVVDSFGSFLGALGPILGIFGGITSIVTTFLTPNPFDELAKYMDKQFDLVHERITDVQGDIADLAKLLEAQGSVLAMSTQIRNIRYAVRNYGSMVDRLAAEPVCGKASLLNLREVDDFLQQYSSAQVDNSLEDLYTVDFGGVTEAGQGLLKPYTKAYCHSHPEYLEKFANEISFYGYAGTMAHFAYRNLDCIKRGNEDCDETEEQKRDWLEKLHKFLKKAEVFKVAAINLPYALYLDVKSDMEKLIDEEVEKVGPTATEFPGLIGKVYDLIEGKVTNRNDWSNHCVLRVKGRDTGTHVLEVAQVNENSFFHYNDDGNVPWHLRVNSRRFYVEKRNTDRSYTSVGITCGHVLDGVKYCRAPAHNVPTTAPKDRVLFLMFNPRLYQAHYAMPSIIQKPRQSVFIDFRDVYAYYDNDGNSGMEGNVHVNCFHGCYGPGESQFALIKNT